MTYRILSLDGGGIRGIMPAIWLGELERRLDRPLNQCFDLIAGTSTGALLGCSIALGKPASDIVDLYRDYGQQIFPRRFAPHFRQAFLGPKYDGAGLREAAVRVFGDAKLSALTPRTLATSYETFTGRPFIFDSTRANGHSVADACLASSAAPTFFPAHILMDPATGQQLSLIDGGVVANNPTVLAISMAVKELGNGLDTMVVASFGTGETDNEIPAGEAQWRSGMQWLPDLVPTLFDAGSDATHLEAREMVPNYWRFQYGLKRAYSSMDDASPENLQALQNFAAKYLGSDAGRRQMDELVQKLGEVQ